MLYTFDENGEKVVEAFLVKFKENDDQFVGVGRSKKNDMVCSEVTVSRQHAKFLWIAGQLYLYDLNSMFGTSANLRGNIPLQFINNKRFLLHRNLVLFHVLKNEDPCCCYSSDFKIIKNPINYDPI